MGIIRSLRLRLLTWRVRRARRLLLRAERLSGSACWAERYRAVDLARRALRKVEA